ncbi:MAG TPA: hypothetical protein VGD98_08025 [Ktedonobacteraceae bacterium]
MLHLAPGAAVLALEAFIRPGDCHNRGRIRIIIRGDIIDASTKALESRIVAASLRLTLISARRDIGTNKICPVLECSLASGDPGQISGPGATTSGLEPFVAARNCDDRGIIRIVVCQYITNVTAESFEPGVVTSRRAFPGAIRSRLDIASHTPGAIAKGSEARLRRWLARGADSGRGQACLSAGLRGGNLCGTTAVIPGAVGDRADHNQGNNDSNDYGNHAPGAPTAYWRQWLWWCGLPGLLPLRWWVRLWWHSRQDC